MKKFILILAILSVSFIDAQAYIGKNDNKFQVGLNAQDNGTGINISYDYGVGDNISFGFSSTYLLGIEESIDAGFTDRFDIRARFNANLGNVINVSDNFDIYPGLSLGMKNFGGHLGMRYFFTEGFGIYTELNTPLAKFNSDTLTSAEMLHNQFTVNFGASFNL
ncbi:hypothetical protein EYD45_14795 [Hyunsoonleella flava]|uniref:Outer membrane protein beta-barrel domain-containing protein n=1 Tax=Hyunsoonleella flava TaxID=2527939 RepID=A0A4Q9FAM5_9FLAO|nr:DUF6646 family protein [Hyunsoonleella flava]TBN00204.1 hypothetical protein EYD45_14795 [Hyunsoonleella flava]